MRLRGKGLAGDLRVGIVALVAVILISLLIVRLDRNKGVFLGADTFQAKLKNLKGLRLGAPVQLSGVEVGNIRKSSFDDAGFIAVEFSIKRSLSHLVTAGSFVTIESQGMLGDKFLLVHPGLRDRPILANGSFLPYRDSQGLFDLAGSAGDSVEMMKSILTKLDALLNEVQSGQGTMGKLFKDENLYTESEEILARLNSNFRKNGSLAMLLRDPKLYKNVSSASQTLASLLSRAEAEQGPLYQLLASKEMSEKLDHLISQLNELVKESTELVDDIQKRPKRYFRVSVF